MYGMFANFIVILKGTYMKLEDKMNYEYYECWIEFWLPIYRQQVIECKLENNSKALLEIYNNINKNLTLKEYKEYIFELLGIKYLTNNDVDSVIIKSYFKNKKKKELLYDDSR